MGDPSPRSLRGYASVQEPFRRSFLHLKSSPETRTSSSGHCPCSLHAAQGWDRFTHESLRWQARYMDSEAQDFSRTQLTEVFRYKIKNRNTGTLCWTLKSNADSTRSWPPPPRTRSKSLLLKVDLWYNQKGGGESQQVQQVWPRKSPT